MATAPDPGWCITDSVLADGGTVHIRPITPEDGAALLAFHARLSDETIHLRFFSNHRHLRPQEVEHFTHVDHDQRMALVAVLHGQIIAVARYDRIVADEAEVAFVVEDAHQGRGLGTLLLEHLAAFVSRWPTGSPRWAMASTASVSGGGVTRRCSALPSDSSDA